MRRDLIPSPGRTARSSPAPSAAAAPRRPRTPGTPPSAPPQDRGLRRRHGRKGGGERGRRGLTLAKRLTVRKKVTRRWGFRGALREALLTAASCWMIQKERSTATRLSRRKSTPSWRAQGLRSSQKFPPIPIRKALRLPAPCSLAHRRKSPPCSAQTAAIGRFRKTDPENLGGRRRCRPS